MTYETTVELVRPNTWKTRLCLFLNIYDMVEYEVPVEVDFIPGCSYPATRDHDDESVDLEILSVDLEILSVVNQLTGQEIELNKEQTDRLADECADYYTGLQDDYPTERY